MKIINNVEIIKKKLKKEKDFAINPIDLSLSVIPPYKGNSKIKLIILGQAPTIKNEKSRKNITCTLNLDKNNSLRYYVNSICKGLGITIENVYATNLFKYFYTTPPAKTMLVLFNHLGPNLNLLKEELSVFKNASIITLGEPVLKLITDENAKVRVYWDYDSKTRMSNRNFILSKAEDNKLNLDFFLFPHQPSIRKEFYKNTIKYYIKLMLSKI